MMTIRAGLGVSALLCVAGMAMGQEQLFALANPTSPTLLELDPTSGAILDSHAITGAEALFGGLAADPAGTLYSIDGFNDSNSDRLFRIDRSTGAGSVVGETRFNWNFRCVTWDPTTGTLYGATDNRVYTLNTSTGEATLRWNVSAPNLDQLTALAIDAHGTAYFTDIGDTDLFSLDLSSGQAAFIGSVGQSGNWFEDLAFDSTGRLWGSRVTGGVYTIDLTTAAQTLQFAGSYNGLVFVGGAQPCYANCDQSTAQPVLNVNDFICFQGKFAAGDSYANCDQSTTEPVLNVNDFVCFQSQFAAGCR
jgi:hypothetical protein